MNSHDEKWWAIYFAGILAMRFHPRNDNFRQGYYQDQIDMATRVADLAVQAHRERFAQGEE